MEAAPSSHLEPRSAILLVVSRIQTWSLTPEALPLQSDSSSSVRFHAGVGISERREISLPIISQPADIGRDIGRLIVESGLK